MAWRLCGNQVKLWRQDAGVSREQLADEAGYGPETIRAMEQGRRRPTQRLLDIADEMCGARGKLRAASAYLEPERYGPRVREFVTAEAAAIAVHSYQTLLIPGLLQTEEYARIMMSLHCPPLDNDTVERRLAGRLGRQELLTKQDVMFTFVIYEAALRTAIGGPEAMKRQLRHLLKAGEQRNITIQVLPEVRGMHPGLYGPFVLLEMPEFDYCAFEEGQNTSALYAEPEQVSLLLRRHALIRAEALGAEESAEFISRTAEQL
ncbi:helix-turn-helix transcriptional regulator [Streptomyces sp. AV19]|uniref:helix-turn-helix domain-containing protein n=1 Tax=Streptomyces sp. AV19 TaxID=2793068 RepID=UPI0018FE1E3B|nr:helix-turn-helix transcriptional regulator [Streptomyces sp. AV19]MBH1933738.1 helix-turn-helix transcriptional regulator [Streptomyces sp. AV19]MDG4535757.1 helix-turn-helix transcriptional regulator [Streptomyces sp. AV19]